MNAIPNRIPHTRIRSAHPQRGAALAVSLILLLILTLLAISGMNTATTELIMAGNEQYQANAFQAAETGIERTIATGPFNPQSPPPPVTQPLANGDSFTAQVLPRGFGSIVVGSSIGVFGGEHFEIQSTGNSARRGARSTHTQGVALLVQDPNQ